MTEFEVVAKEKMQQKNHSHSLSQGRKLPLRASIRLLDKMGAQQVLYYGVFTMLRCKSFLNIGPDPSDLIKQILSSRKMKIVPTNMKLNAMVFGWNVNKTTVSSDIPTVNFDGIVGEDELSSQSIYEFGLNKYFLPYEGLFGNEIPIQEDRLMRIYTNLLKALNDIRFQSAANSGPLMKFKGNPFNTLITQVKAKEVVTDVDDVEFEDWCVTNTHAHFWYCANVLKSPLLKMAIENVIKNHQILIYLNVCLIQVMTYENISLLDLSLLILPSPIF